MTTLPTFPASVTAWRAAVCGNAKRRWFVVRTADRNATDWRGQMEYYRDAKGDLIRFASSAAAVACAARLEGGAS